MSTKALLLGFTTVSTCRISLFIWKSRGRVMCALSKSGSPAPSSFVAAMGFCEARPELSPVSCVASWPVLIFLSEIEVLWTFLFATLL